MRPRSNACSTDSKSNPVTKTDHFLLQAATIVAAFFFGIAHYIGEDTKVRHGPTVSSGTGQGGMQPFEAEHINHPALIFMKEIKLTRGKTALVDDEDFDRLNQFKWYAQKVGSGFYAARKRLRDNGKEELIYMHSEVMPSRIGFEIDHKFGDGLDNRKENLRFVTRQQNNINRGNFKNNTSGFKGVSRVRDKWRAYIRFNYRQIYLGQYSSAEEASLAYVAAAQKYFGEFQRAA